MWRAGKRNDDVLEECLARLARGETVAQCLAQYPDRALELGPALEAASRLMGQHMRLAPGPGFRGQARRRLLRAFSEQRGQVRRPWGLSRLAGPRLVAVGASFLVVVALGLGTTYRAAAQSVPGEPLYWLKDKTEQVRLALPRSQEAQAHLQADLAEERAKEGGALLQKGTPDRLPQAEERFRHQVQEALKTAGAHPGEANRPKGPALPKQQKLQQELSQRLRQQAQRQAAELQRMLQTASPEMKPHYRRLQATLEEEYGQALKELEEPESPPGRALDPH